MLELRRGRDQLLEVEPPTRLLAGDLGTLSEGCGQQPLIHGTTVHISGDALI